MEASRNILRGIDMRCACFCCSYSTDSPELQHRKLGDLSFLVQHYELAYTSYHSAKREFNNDHAWLYFAGSLVSLLCSRFFLCAGSGTSMHRD